MRPLCIYDKSQNLVCWPVKSFLYLQSNLKNLKSLGQEVLYLIISCLNYREVDIQVAYKHVTLKNDYFQCVPNVPGISN